MRRLIAIAAFVACFVPVARADEAAERILKGVEQRLAAMGVYRVDFAVEAGDYRTTGTYTVAGRDFYLQADDTEVYAEAGVRREISRSKREIVVDSIDAAAHDIISNPSAGLAGLTESFDSVTTVGADGNYCITLTPKQAGASHETITVVVAKEGELPKAIIYNNSSSGAITVRLLTIAPSATGVPHFDMSRYSGYEVVEM